LRGPSQKIFEMVAMRRAVRREGADVAYCCCSRRSRVG
jgi:hypothetical protein